MQSTTFNRLLAGATLMLAAFFGGSAQAYSSLVVFGDSLSDSGNNALVVGADPGQVITGNTYVPLQPYGLNAYSNGQTWVHAFAAGLGLTAWAAPSLAGGGNYAYGGARTVLDGTDPTPVPPGFPPSATTQMTGTGPLPYQFGYLAGLASVPADGLYVIAIGGNDVRDLTLSVALGGTPATAILGLAAAYASAVGSLVDALQAKGAQRIIVWDAPNIGSTPAALSGGPLFAGLATSVASSFNAALSARLFGEAGVSIFDVFGVTDSIVTNPGAYGLANVTDACGAVVSCDPSTYLFWDGIHPTSAGHAVIASAMLAAAVPEPATGVLLACGGVLLLCLRRRN